MIGGKGVSLFSSAFSSLLVRVNILEGCCSAVNGSFWMCLNHILVLILPLVCLPIFSIDKRTLRGLIYCSLQIFFLVGYLLSTYGGFCYREALISCSRICQPFIMCALGGSTHLPSVLHSRLM